MSLTPIDILHTQFKTALKGYDKAQVDEFVRSAMEALEQALSEKNELQRRVELLQEEVDRVKGIETTMVEALALAQKTADDVKSNAHRRAEMVLQEAEQERVRMTVDAQKEAEKYRTEVALLQATRDRFEAELRAMLTGYMEWLDRRSNSEGVRSEVA